MNAPPAVATRVVDPSALSTLTAAGLHPILARVLAARSVAKESQLDTSMGTLLAPATMRGLAEAALLLADAVQAGAKLLIVADYDADGATACAVGLRGMRAMGANIDYLVPNRFEFGYGLTPEIVRVAHSRAPDFIITVDNGIASVDGVDEANRLGMRVIVTDHHLPGPRLPNAAAIVNPNQPGCEFPSKHLAGCGVMFYVLLAVRAELRKRGHWPDAAAPPNFATLLDIIALGTVADVVKLDDNNRRLVTHGLARIRAGKACAGIRALLRVAARDAARISSYDLGFMVGPRLNAAGRLTDMSLGIECLLTDDETRAHAMAIELDRLNRERREIEANMQDSALERLADLDPQENYTLSVFEPDWHQGVIGILASRLKDRFHRPTIAFARGGDGLLKGSGRSIGALHLRDALDLVTKRNPELIIKFGGHAAAAGLTIREEHLDQFRQLFEVVTRELLSDSDLTRVIETDGELLATELSLELARILEGQVWGQGFPAPKFVGQFTVADQRIVGEKHLKLKLRMDNREFDAIWFFHDQPLPKSVRAVYRPDVNEFNGTQRLQLLVEHCDTE